jgi:hypothetical protein
MYYRAVRELYAGGETLLGQQRRVDSIRCQHGVSIRAANIKSTDGKTLDGSERDTHPVGHSGCAHKLVNTSVGVHDVEDGPQCRYLDIETSVCRKDRAQSAQQARQESMSTYFERTWHQARERFEITVAMSAESVMRVQRRNTHNIVYYTWQKKENLEHIVSKEGIQKQYCGKTPEQIKEREGRRYQQAEEWDIA